MGKLPYYTAAVTGALAIVAVTIGLIQDIALLQSLGLAAWGASLLSIVIDCRHLEDRYQFDGKDIGMRWHHYVIPGLVVFIAAWPLYLHGRYLINRHEKQQLDEIREIEGEAV